MPFSETIALGALAGFTIYLGLPAGRLQLLGARSRVALAMFAVGVLAFIFVDVLANAGSIVNQSVDQVKDHHGSVGHLIWLVVLLGAGFAAGSAGLAMVEHRLRPLGPQNEPSWQASACWATWRSVTRSPPPAIITGGAGRCTGG